MAAQHSVVDRQTGNLHISPAIAAAEQSLPVWNTATWDPARVGHATEHAERAQRTNGEIMFRVHTRRVRIIGLAVAATFVIASCGSDDDATDTTAAATEGTEAAAATTEAATEGTEAATDTTEEATTEEIGVIGYVVAGDRNDGGFYQGQVDAVEAAAAESGFEVIVVDQVNPGASREAFENLARQSPDLIIAGGSELGDGMVPVSEAPEFADITFLMVTGAPPQGSTYATVGANENEAHYVGGVATGLLLQRSEASTACIVAGPELPFVQDMAKSMQAGLASVAPDAELLVTYTGDFEDAALAQEAVTAQINQGCQVVYPYLGGALTAVLTAGQEAGIDLTSTSVDRCGDPTIDFAMSITYNPALYLNEAIAAFGAGEIVEGEQWALFGVNDGVGVGANICDVTDEEQAVIDEAVAGIGSGEIADWTS